MKTKLALGGLVMVCLCGRVNADSTAAAAGSQSTFVPEPSTLLLLGIGMIGLLYTASKGLTVAR